MPASRPLKRELHDLRMLSDAIRLSTHVLMNDPAQLPGQLLGRLDGSEFPTLKPLLTQLSEPRQTRFPFADNPLLVPVTCSLHPPGTGAAAHPAGPFGRGPRRGRGAGRPRAISASWDQTLRVWDLDDGKDGVHPAGPFEVGQRRGRDAGRPACDLRVRRPDAAGVGP